LREITRRKFGNRYLPYFLGGEEQGFGKEMDGEVQVTFFFSKEMSLQQLFLSTQPSHAYDPQWKGFSV